MCDKLTFENRWQINKCGCSVNTAKSKPSLDEIKLSDKPCSKEDCAKMILYL